MNNYKKHLNDKDFYEQACSYFYYHAEQRTTMINYFIAVFGASVALYGSLITSNPVACVLISIFLFAISILFYSIDLRNRFDVKQSQSVIAQIERDYYRDTLKDKEQKSVYGVFSNEDNTFKYYNFEKRRLKENKKYRELRKFYKWIKMLKALRFKKSYIEKLENQLSNEAKNLWNNSKTISFEEFENSIASGSIISLSNSIRIMYFLCMIISLLGIGYALYEAGILNILKK